MIDFLQQYISSEPTSENKINRLREALQLLCLKILQDKNYFSHLAFVGGTALRVLYNLRRFSEDLDFSVIDQRRYSFPEVVSALKREFGLYGLDLEAKTKAEKTVQNCMLKFPGLLKKSMLSNLPGQKLSIKVEVDSHPPSGWRFENTLVNNIYLLNITHFDLPSLYASKIHACFFRRYAKGRDFYDLVWYLGRKIEPNYTLLNNAIKQTEGKDLGLNNKNIAGFLLKRTAKIDFKAIKKDVERFLEDKNELMLLDASLISKSIIEIFSDRSKYLE